MKTKYLFFISLFLIILLVLPVSFASTDDSASIASIDDSASYLNENNEADLKISTPLNDYETDLDNNNINTESMACPTHTQKSDGESGDLGAAITNEETENGELGNPITSLESENLKGDIYSDYSDYINLKSEMLTYDFNLSESNTIYVNSNYDGDEELGSQLKPFKTINAAYNLFIDSSNTKTNIFLYEGTYVISKKMTINKNLNIIGESSTNTIISGNDEYEMFLISPPLSYYAISPLVNFVNLTFAKGSSYYGGAVYINQSAVNFVNAKFINNTARDYISYYGQKTYPASGGAIYNDKGFVRIYNALFEGNSASGSQDSYAGAVFNDMGEMTILNSKFINNSVNGTYGSGGAIYDYSGILVIYNSSISGNVVNSSYSLGGGICNWASHNVFIINSTIDGNQLHGNYTFGSAVSNKATLLEIHNTTISNNKANGICDENGTFFNLNGIVNLTDVQFINNEKGNTDNSLLMCLEDQIIISKAFDDALLVDLPSSYDLRDYGLVTPVRDQGGSGSCWAFSTIAAIESYLLKNENISYDLSENNMKNLMGIYGLNGTDWADGGNHYMSLAYLLRWSGPVNESDDPFSDWDTSSPTRLNQTKHVQDVLFIPLRLNYRDLNQIKYALMIYGALYTTMNADDSLQYEPDYYHDIIDVSNHAVTLIGWDDNYSADKFAVRPPGDGAFIIKNSWGTGHGYDGYWYVSYYDKAFAGFGMETISAMAITNVENRSNYKNIYQYDILGNTFESLGFNSHTAWMANQFRAQNNNPLTAFGLYTFGDSDYLVNITVNGVSKYVQEGIIKGAGYHTIKLLESVELAKNDIFRIAVKLTTPDSLYPIAIESKRQDYSSGAGAHQNESFISIDGVNWIDLVAYENSNNDGMSIIKFYQYMQNYNLKEANVCLKAYTSGLADVYLSIKSNSSTYKPGDLLEISITASNEGDLVRDLNISMNLDSSLKIQTFQIIKGSFNSDTGIWHLDSLDEGESTMLKLTLLVNQAKDIAESLFSFDYNGFKPSNFSTSNAFNLYYEGNTMFNKVENITALAKSNEYVKITLLDQKSNPMAGKEIIISLIGKDNNLKFNSLSLISDENGSVDFALNFIEGNYIFLASYNGDSFYKPSNMTFNVSVSKRESPHIIAEETLIDNGDEFKILLIDDEYNPIPNKLVKFVVYSDKKTLATYTAKTNNEGVATLTGLSKIVNGAYTVSVSFHDDCYKDASLLIGITIKNSKASSSQSSAVKTNSGSKITKKATKLYVSKKTFKKKAKVKKLTAKLKSGKKVLKSKKVIFTVNGKKYVAKTNKKGIATVKIKLSKKKTYKVKVRFAGDKNYKASKKTSKVVIK